MTTSQNSSVSGQALTISDHTMPNVSNINVSTMDPLCLLNEACKPIDEHLEDMYKEIFPDTGKWVLIAIYIITFLVGLIGNGLVCFAIWRNRNMRTVTNIFIVNLSVADLAVIIVVLPTTLLVDVTFTWFFGTVVCKINIFLSTLSVSVSVLTLTTISVERWYAICHPLRFHSTVRRARNIIIAIWLISFCVALPDFFFASVVEAYSYTVLFSACYPALIEYDDVVTQQICLMVALYFVPLCLMGFAYTNIAIVLWNGHIPGEETRGGRQPMLNRSNTCNDTDDQVASRRKAAKMLFTIVIMFAVCFLPNHLLNLLRYTRVLEAADFPETFALFAHWLACLNSCINPLIYNFMSDKFRKEFRQAVSMCLRCKYGRQAQSFRRNDTYKVTFTSTPTLSCHLSNSPLTKKSYQDGGRVSSMSYRS